MASNVRTSAGFEAFPDGQRFCIHWSPAGIAPRRTLVLLPPFGEEMNKSRRTIALAARLFASRGIAVYAFDPMGTGDSEGEFGEATWAQWGIDAQVAVARASEQFPAPVTLWAVRSGSLLLPGINHSDCDLLLWQPVVSGDTFLTQLLRLKVANDAFAGREGTTTKQLRALLASGEVLEIAGYELDPALVLPMAAINLQTWSPGRGRAIWLETGADAAGQMAPASQRVAEAWSAGGTSTQLQHVSGEQFWLTQEIAENNAIAQASLDALDAVPA